MALDPLTTPPQFPPQPRQAKPRSQNGGCRRKNTHRLRRLPGAPPRHLAA
ncbi:hypothetical protein ACRB68_28130 [Actinomadura sp. RB68]|uniref:Uncharacterized protein n=1 Tax=Actinomadura macrotermitis TaxID=2585200 RepID=A0A7K0BUC4_9ACTN|nr:hypothetical protein [Actinomadura macrotermitis]